MKLDTRAKENAWRLKHFGFRLSLNYFLFVTQGWHEIDDSIPRFQGKLDRIAKLFEEVQIYQTNSRIPRGTESKSFRLRRSPQMHRKRASSWHVPTGGRWILVIFSHKQVFTDVRKYSVWSGWTLYRTSLRIYVYMVYNYPYLCRSRSVLYWQKGQQETKLHKIRQTFDVNAKVCQGSKEVSICLAYFSCPLASV